MDRNCGNCRWWDARFDKRGRRIKRDDHRLCKAPIPEMPLLPESITRGMNRHSYGSFQWPPRRTYIGAKDGTDCPLFAAETIPPEGNR